MNIAIVVSEFNNEVTSRMHKVALEKAKGLKLNVKYECKVPGIFEEFPKDIDVVFIDASHLYPHAFMDTINSILYFDKPIIVFDDYGTEYPVRKAVNDLVKLNLLKYVR